MADLTKAAQQASEAFDVFADADDFATLFELTKKMNALRDALAQRPAAQEVAMTDWVSVQDQLPEKYTEVLVAFEGIVLASTGQYTGSIKDVNGWSYPSENRGSTDQGTDPIITHWMPLPEVPGSLTAQAKEADRG